MDELVIDNLVYIPSKKAAEITGYAKDYVGQLCREGRIEAKLVGRSWYVLESSIREHRFGTGTSEVPVRSEEVVAEEKEDTTPSPEPAPEEEVLATWRPATYSPEPIAVVEESRQTTYLENTEQNESDISTKPTQVEEVQNAWQEWFSRNENTQGEITHPAETEPEDPTVAQAVPINKRVAVEVDAIEERKPVQAAEEQNHSYEEQPIQRQRTPQVAQKRGRRPSTLAYKSIFIGVIIITLAVTVIGTGSLDALSPSWASKGSFIDYLAGVTNFSR